MPVAPPELTAEITVRGSAEGVREAAAATGLAREAGPDAIALGGDRDSVLQGLVRVVEAALDAGARDVRVQLEAPAEPWDRS